MTGVQSPRWDLAPAALTPGEGFGILLQDPDISPPVMDSKVQAQAIPCVGGPQAYGEGAGAFLSRSRKDHILHLGLVLCLTDSQTAPDDCGFRPVHKLAACRH